MFNLMKLLRKDPQQLLELAYGKIESEVVGMRCDLGKSLAKSIGVEEQKEENNKRRQVLNEAETQIQTIYILKQWAIPIALLLDPTCSEEVSNKYSQLTKSIANRFEQYRKLGDKRTLNDTIELHRQMLDVEDATNQLEQLVIKRIENAIETFNGSHQPAPEKLIALKLPLEHKLAVFTEQASMWQTRAQSAMQQNHNELAQQALERQKQYDKGCESIRAVFARLEEAIAAISTGHQTDT